MGLIGDIFGSLNSAKAAKSAANAGQIGAQNAQALEKTNQTNALNTQAQATSTNAAQEQPYVAAGATSVNNLAAIANNPNSTTYGQTFSAPTLEQAEQMPGYQFQLQQGTQAIDQNAAANGTLMSGNTGKALQNYGQGLAQTDYNNLYNQALQTYQQNYNQWNTAQQQQFGELGTVAGMGQTAVGQQGQLGQAGAQNAAGIDLTGGQQQAQQINNAAAARASGYLGQANAYNSGISNIDKQLTQTAAMAYQLGM